jgi:CTP synthase
MRYIFVTGGVVSSLGKGIAAASIGALLQSRGFKIRIRKLEPYLNVDPGTMSPYQHGEVFVTEDGAETDLDLGHYERFTGVDTCKSDILSSGRVYLNILNKERRGDYLGATVQIIPHVTDAIKEFIQEDTSDLDFLIVEIGGTVGDIEGLPYLEAIRQMGHELRSQVLFVHLTLVPFIPSAGELKTKPTQHSVKNLQSLGIQPHILLCRCDRMIPEDSKKKLAQFCNVPSNCVIEALDVESIYEVPLVFNEEGLTERILEHFHLESKPASLEKWENVVQIIKSPVKTVKIGLVGKYVGLQDAYKSVKEALIHGGLANNAKVEIEWIDCEDLEEKGYQQRLQGLHGIIIAGGFGKRGTQGMINALEYTRTHKIPTLGICYGMQMAVIEFARNILGIVDAKSSEWDENGTNIIGLLTEWVKGDEIEQRDENSDLGGTMRLGSYECHLSDHTRVKEAYGSPIIHERHRHRYEVNMDYKEQFESKGLLFSGISPDGKLPEIIELQDHPWFIGVQFHPELKSRPFAPAPLFKDLIRVAIEEMDAS